MYENCSCKSTTMSAGENVMYIYIFYSRVRSFVPLFFSFSSLSFSIIDTLFFLSHALIPLFSAVPSISSRRSLSHPPFQERNFKTTLVEIKQFYGRCEPLHGWLLPKNIMSQRYVYPILPRIYTYFYRVCNAQEVLTKYFFYDFRDRASRSANGK